MPRIKYDDKAWLNEDCKLRGVGDELEGAFIQHQTAQGMRINSSHAEETNNGKRSNQD